MKSIKKTFIVLIAIIMIPSCKNEQSHIEENDDYIIITREQFNSENMSIGEIERRVFEDIVTCNGTITNLPDGMALVGASYSGSIQKILVQNGQMVHKGQVLIEIAGNELIDLQKEFAETAALFTRLNSEYERIKILYKEKVTSEKEYISAESEFHAVRAKYNGLKIKIDELGLPSAEIEKGMFQKLYQIKAPISGQISEIFINTGEYIEPQTPLMRINNPEKSQVKLSVFANDISKIQKGQQVLIKPVNSDHPYNALISSIGSFLNTDSKSVDCFASIQDANFRNPIQNLFVESEIIISRDSLFSLPVEAVIHSENNQFVLILENEDEENYYFRKQTVETGRVNEKYIEVYDDLLEIKILVKGLYNLVI